jgi:hypothetical protein
MNCPEYVSHVVVTADGRVLIGSIRTDHEKLIGSNFKR